MNGKKGKKDMHRQIRWTRNLNKISHLMRKVAKEKLRTCVWWHFRQPVKQDFYELHGHESSTELTARTITAYVKKRLAFYKCIEKGSIEPRVT